MTTIIMKINKQANIENNSLSNNSDFANKQILNDKQTFINNNIDNK